MKNRLYDIFDRLAQETTAYYLLAVEEEPGDQ